MAFKKQQRRQNKSISLNEFLKLLRPQLTPYFKKKSPLEWVGHFIEGLPQKDGCFHLPLIKQKPFETCPGSCPFQSSGKALTFKVDLVNENENTQKTNLVNTPNPALNPSQNPLRQKQRYIRSSKKSGSKRLKICSQSKSQKERTSNQRPTSKFNYDVLFPGFGSSISKFQTKAESAKPHKDCSKPSFATLANFKAWNEQTSNHRGPLFNEESNLDDRSFLASNISENFWKETISNQSEDLESNSIEGQGPSSSVKIEAEDASESSVGDQTSGQGKKGQKSQKVLLELMGSRLKNGKEIEAKKSKLAKIQVEIDQLEEENVGIEKAIFKMLGEQHQEKGGDKTPENKD